MKLSFEVHYYTEYGEQLVFACSIKELGYWDPEKSPVFTWNPGHIWTFQMEWPPHYHMFEYKFVVVDTRINNHHFLFRSGRRYRWEQGANRTIMSSHKRLDKMDITIRLIQRWDLILSHDLDSVIPPSVEADEFISGKLKRGDESEESKEEAFIETDEGIDALSRTLHNLPDRPFLPSPSSPRRLTVPPISWNSYSPYSDVIIIDSGSRLTRAGYCDIVNHHPTLSVSTAFATLKDSLQPTFLALSPDIDVTHDTPTKLLYDIHWPMSGGGVVKNFEGIEVVWKYVLKQLQTDPDHHRKRSIPDKTPPRQPKNKKGSRPKYQSDEKPYVLLSESVMNPQTVRERSVEIFLEELNVGAISLKSQEELCLYNFSYEGSGLVVSSGVYCTYIVPIYCSNVMREFISSTNLAGENLSEELRQSFGIDQSHWNSKYEFWEHIKCGLTVPHASSLSSPAFSPRGSEKGRTSITLPNGTVYYFDDSHHQLCESFFTDTGKNKSIPTLIHETIQKCPTFLHKFFYNNIVLCGRTTSLKGFSERLTQELKMTAPVDHPVRVLSSESSPIGNEVWRGGSLLCSNPLITPYIFVSRQLYDEVGPSVIKYMCL